MPYADPIRLKEYKAEWHQLNKARLNANARIDYQKNKKKYAKLGKQRYQEKRGIIDKQNREWAKKNPERVKAIKRKWEDNPKNKIAKRKRNTQYRLESKEFIKQQNKIYTIKNRLSIIKRRKKHYESNKNGSIKAYNQQDYVRARQNEGSSRYKLQKSRTSKFELNNAKNITKVFELSRKKTKETGRQYHVDHIIPIRGKGVSGFHVAGNLRVVLAHTNISKNNRYTARDEALTQRRMIKDWVANEIDFKLYKPKKKRKAA